MIVLGFKRLQNAHTINKIGETESINKKLGNRKKNLLKHQVVKHHFDQNENKADLIFV